MSEYLPRYRRRLFFGLAGADIAKGVGFGARVYVRVPKNLLIAGPGWVGPECYFENHAPIRIGSGVSIAARCILETASHEIGPSDGRAGTFFAEGITIHDGVWLGTNVTVLPGVTLGRGAVVAAGSVVTKDCEPDTMYAGVPAVPKKKLPAQ